MIRVGLYLRVSSDDRTIENQRIDLMKVASRMEDWEIVQEFCDEGISGSKGRDKRPGLDRAMRAATRREIDMIAAWSVDRIGRSMQHLMNFMAEMQASNCDLYLHQQAINTKTPAGRALFQMSGVFAEFELAMIKERIRAGIARAKAAGIHCGRAPIGPEKEARIREMLKAGEKVSKIPSIIGCGQNVVYRVRDQMAAAI